MKDTLTAPSPPVVWPVIVVTVLSSVISVGGIGEAVASAVASEPGIVVHRLAVSHVPRSGKAAELLQMFGIDKEAIVQAVKKAISSSANGK